jgi:hypothetical protein
MQLMLLELVAKLAARLLLRQLSAGFESPHQKNKMGE